MATTLGQAIDATQDIFDVSSDELLTGKSYPVRVTIGSEILYVTGAGTLSFHDTARRRWSVERGADGSTAASHAVNAAVTAADLGTGGGAGGVTIDNLTDPPAEVTTLVSAGATIAGSEATLRGKDFYAQDDDPGAVGTGSVWKDTDASPKRWAERNAADDDWDPNVDIFVGAVADEEAVARTRAYTTGAGDALVGPVAITEGLGDADSRPSATSGGGMLGAGFTGSALAGPQASSDDGVANVAALATTSGVGDALAGGSATALDAGDAGVNNDATATAGNASISTQAIRGAANAGMTASVEADGIPRLGFNAVAATGGIAIPVIPASPTEQDIADVLVALGLATQAA